MNDKTKTSDKLDTNKTQAEKNFYAEKMKNITEGEIYQLVNDLCLKFCRYSEYKVKHSTEEKNNNTDQKKHDEFQASYRKKYDTLIGQPAIFKALNFKALNFFGPESENNDKQFASVLSDGFKAPDFFHQKPQNIGLSLSDLSLFKDDRKFEPFLFFEVVNPNEFTEDIKKNPKVIANYVKQFAHYLSVLFEDIDFVYFLISSEENIETLGKIIGFDFVLEGDVKNPYLFKESHLLEVGTSLVRTYDIYCRCYEDETQETHEKKKKLQPFILDYLNKTFAISSKALHVLLFDNGFYETFADTENMNKIIIDAIKKTDFHCYSFGRSCDSIKRLNELLGKCETNNKEDCFYNKMNDEGCKEIKDALADKCAEIFADTKESVKINLDTLTKSYKCPCVCNFMSNYLSDEKNRNSETGKKLINALKTWLDNKDLLLWERSYESNNLNYNYDINELNLFLCDDNLKKSFANACSRTIKHLIAKDYKQDSMYRPKKLEEIKTKSKSFLQQFNITLKDYDFSDVPYKTHGKNVAWLSLWILLSLMCIAIIAVLFTLVSMNIILKVIVSLIVWFFFIFKILPNALERAFGIHIDRRYNAKLGIYKYKAEIEMEAKDKIPYVKQNNENKNLPDV